MSLLRSICFLVVVTAASPLSAAVQVAVGIEPLRYLVEQIGAERVQVSTLLRNGDPHVLDPTPAQLLALKRASVYFGVGLSFERKFHELLGDRDSLVWLLDLEDQAHQVSDHDHEHSHGHGDGLDLHSWTSPAQMRLMAAQVAEQLQRLDPAGAAAFAQRLGVFQQKVDTLQRRIEQILQTAPSTLVADHPAWGWFCREFGLRQLALEHEGKLPSIRQMSTLKKAAASGGARDVVSQHGGAQAQALAERLNLRLLVVDPLSFHWDTNLIALAEGLAAP